MIAGEAFGYSGYPEFNGPHEIGTALIDTGFDVVNHATNHTMDKGEAAVYAVMDFWDKHSNILVLGIYRSKEQRDTRRAIIKKNNITIGWLAYTYGTNGIPLPKAKPYLVSLIDTQVMAREIAELRLLCDFLIVSMHWGEEYRHTTSKRQEELALFLAENNVDLVLGHHPHVIQPVREYPRTGDGKTVVFFSLGNFLSSQKELPRLLGAMAHITVTKTENKSAPQPVFVKEAEIIPIVTHYDKEYKHFKVYPLAAYTKELAEKHGINSAEKLTPDYFKTLFNSVFSSALTKGIHTQ